MKAKKGFKLRDVCGEKIIVAEGKENIDFSNIISMNETAAYLCEQLYGKEFSVDNMADLLTEQYDIDRETASMDVASLTRKWASLGIIEGFESEIPTDEPSLEYKADRDNTTEEINTNCNTTEKKRKGLFGKLFGK